MSEPIQVLVEPTAESATRLAAELLASIACEAVGQHNRFTLALAGGTTPHHLYEYLANPPQADKIPWQSTQIFFGDERNVPHDHVDSNYRMAEDTLLGRVPIRFENVHPMPADSVNLEQAAQLYAESVIDAVPAGPDGIPAFDLILLGMGGDGHTASLFPGTHALDEPQKLVVSQYVPVLSRWRMTFTYPLINAARIIMFLITGMDKAEAVQYVLSEDPTVSRQMPAGRVKPTHGKLIYILDAEAARLTRYRQTKGATT